MEHFNPVKVFIGSGEASLLERKTLIYSLRKNSKRPLDIYVFNGTHNSIENPDNGEPVLAPLSLRLKYRNVTEFSLYRYLIPQLCNYQGRAIHLDSDMVCLGDIGELFDAPLDGHDFLAKQEAYGNGNWGLSVMLIDCARCKFDLETIMDEVDAGLYSYNEFMQMSPKFLEHHPYNIGHIDPNWNVFDRHDENTKLIHYTKLMSQPWKYPNHPYGDLWFEYFNEALSAGDISDEDMRLTLVRSYVRTNIREGNRPQSQQAQSPVKSVLRKVRNKLSK